MIVNVKAEGVNFLYVTDPLANLSNLNIKFSYNLYLAYNISKIERTRLILDEWTNVANKHTHYSYLYLYWLTPINLDDLDMRVIEGRYSDYDFENSVKCEFHPNEICRKCQKAWEVLAVDRLVMYPDNKDLRKIKFNKLKDNNAVLKCPNCDSNFTESFVVKIFGPATLERSVLEKCSNFKM